MVLLLQRRKLRLREAKSIAQGRAAKIRQSLDSRAGLLIPMLVPFPADTTLPLKIAAPQPPAPSFLTHCVFSSGFYSLCLDSVFFFVFGEKKKNLFHQLALEPTWKKLKCYC